MPVSALRKAGMALRSGSLSLVPIPEPPDLASQGRYGYFSKERIWIELPITFSHLFPTLFAHIIGHLLIIPFSVLLTPFYR